MRRNTSGLDRKSKSSNLYILPKEEAKNINKRNSILIGENTLELKVKVKNKRKISDNPI